MILDTIIYGDCIEILKSLPEESMDFIFADPPYNLQLKNTELIRPNGTIVDGVFDDWDNFESIYHYDKFMWDWIAECRRVLKTNGTISVIGTYHCSFRTGTILQNQGFWTLNDIIYIKNNPTPQMHGVRLCNAHETIIWATKNKKSKYTFNYHLMKKINNGKQMRSDWHFSICSGKERILGEDGKKAHSTQKPLALMQRLILMATKPEDVVLDPFCGTGTTAHACKSLNRHYIGIDNDIKSINISNKRLETVILNTELLELEQEVLNTTNNTPKVPFESLVEKGLIPIGTKLQLFKTPTKPLEIFAFVNASGKLEYDGEIHSIHSAAKKAFNLPTCNGWLYWWIVIDGFNRKCINEFRYKV